MKLVVFENAIDANTIVAINPEMVSEVIPHRTDLSQTLIRMVNRVEHIVRGEFPVVASRLEDGE